MSVPNYFTIVIIITNMLHILRSKAFGLYFISYLLIVGGLLMMILGFGSTIISELDYYLDRMIGIKYTFSNNITDQKEDKSIFATLLEKEVNIKPVNQDFTIIIEKIGVNAPVIENISVVDEKEYFEALKHGVAQAKGKGLPGKPGNTFLFAHSSIEFWKMGPYATVFNQLRRLERWDDIYLVYKGEVYKYKVFYKHVVNGFDTKPYELDYTHGSILTLQTCDPPGTTINRLIVRAYLVE